jgi:endonuclease-3
VDKKNVWAIFKTFERDNPYPKGELHYRSRFELLIAVILSAQATDKSVNAVTRDLFKMFNTPQKFLALGESELKMRIQTIGLYHTKAKHIIKTCRLLINKFNGCVPNNRQALESLPGVGRKTANVILNVVFGHPALAVDTHVFRVANRTGLAPGKTPLTVEKRLLRVIPSWYLKNAPHWLLMHGRYTCMARKPKCAECSIYEFCEYPDKLKIKKRAD